MSGRLQYFKANWTEITDNQSILSWLDGFKIPFVLKPVQKIPPQEPMWSNKEKEILKESISKLLDMGAISMVKTCQNQFLSNIFAVPKPDGTYRLVLNLKYLNKFIKSDHFKMENHKTVAGILKQNAFLAKLDLKDAYFLLPMHESDKKYLRFKFLKKTYEFNCLPFGLNCAPFVFTKLLKPIAIFLRSRKFFSVIYLDDFLLIGDTYMECEKNVHATTKILENLGFLINFKKSNLKPSQQCQYLGFLYNTTNLTISLPDKKKADMLEFVEKFKTKKTCKIQEFAVLVGKLVSICPAVSYGFLYLKPLERIKYLALENSYNNFNATMIVSPQVWEVLNWWKINIPQCLRSLKQPQYEIEIFSDASLTGWGIYCEGNSSHGHWSEEERKMPINFLELKAAFFGLKCFANHLRDKNILLRIDNTTAIAYINKMGGVRYEHLNILCQEIWHWCEKHKIYIFASYIKSAENKEADISSRIIKIETEWELNHKYFQQVLQIFSEPEIDIFASRINRKCEKFVSWFRDPEAWKVDAFTLDWSPLKFYAFPPFSLILRTLQKIITDKAEGIVIIPNWPSQPWYPLFHSLLISKPLIFSPSKDLLLSIDRITPHPLWAQLSLVVGLLSGKHCS